MPIDSPQAIRIANEEIRRVADTLVSCYLTCKTFDQKRIAADYGSIIPNTTEKIMDGSDVDGRLEIVGVQAHYVMARVAEFLALMEESGNARLNTVLPVSVNGRSAM